MRPTHRWLTLLALSALAGCGGGEMEPVPMPPQADQGPSPGRDGGARPGSDASGTSTKLGVVVIDAQESFISYAANKDINQIVDNIRALLVLAGTHQLPLLITYESSNNEATGDAMPAALRAARPPQTQEFIKTTFAATGLAAFAAAVKQAALTHIIVVGAETDVCVLQTVLGLRAMGITVILQRDAVFTSEPNTGPALRRMEQAGVVMATAAEVKAYVEQTGPLPQPAQSGPITIIKPTSIAVLLDELTDAAVSASQDPYKTAKLARLRELLLISEWFDIPLFGTVTTLPTQLAGLITKQIRPAAELDQSAALQIVLAGSDTSLGSLIASHGAGRDLFLLEDGLLASGTGQAAALEQLYQGGAVPLTYKSLYYGMTKSVDLGEWPKAWVDRDPIYYPKTNAPESLPPIIK